MIRGGGAARVYRTQHRMTTWRCVWDFSGFAERSARRDLSTAREWQLADDDGGGGGGDGGG